MMKCYVCGGEMEQQQTTFTTKHNGCVYIVHGVPSFVCSQCGETVFDSKTARRLEEIVNGMKNEASEVSMTTYKAA